MPTPSNPATPSWKVWWRLLRPHTLTASIIPILMGTAVALQGPVHYVPFLGMLSASILIRAATNMFNEYYDFKRGLDDACVGIGGAIVRHGVRSPAVFRLVVALSLAALVIGAYIGQCTTWWLAPIGLICLLAGYLYTGGPYPLAYTPFGELVAGFFMGAVILLISFYVETGYVGPAAVIVAVPEAVLVGAILMANNIHDRAGDRARGRRTGAIRLLAAMFAFSYLWMIATVAMEMMTPWSLLVLLSVPGAARAARGFTGQTTPARMMPAMQATARTNTLFGLLLVPAVLLHLTTAAG